MMMMANMRKKSLLPKVNYNLHYDIHTILSVYYLCLPPSPSELRGYGCREESLLPVGRPLRPEQPAGSSVQSHPLEEDGEFNTIAPHSSGRRSEELL